MNLKRFILTTSTLIALSLLVWSCGHKHKANPEEAPISLEVKTQNVTAKEISQYIVVVAQGDWTLESDKAWVTISPSSGKGNSNSVILTCLENTTVFDREATITLNADGASRQIKILQLSKDANPDSPSTDGKDASVYGWLELPAFNAASYKFVTHEFGSSRPGRNFSYLWSKGDLVALWFAYPMNKAIISSGSRSDRWGLDPKLSSDEQPILYNAYRGGYDRGHQLPSADRLSYQDNVKTFYFTNMTPQLNSLNGGIWATMESQVRSWANRSDTLYVVTGCVVSGSTKKAYDNNGKAVTVPTGYYKAVLRYVNNSTIGHNGYIALGSYFEHRAYTEKSINKNSPMIMSIDDLEKKINIDLFPNLVNVVGEDVAAKIEAENPSNVTWWWN